MTKQIFFGIMTGDLFTGEESVSGELDYGKSESNYIEMCIIALKEAYAKYDEEVEINYASEAVGGAVPYNLTTKVNDKADHKDVEFVDSVISEVWMSWEWAVSKEV